MNDKPNTITTTSYERGRFKLRHALATIAAALLLCASMLSIGCTQSTASSSEQSSSSSSSSAIASSSTSSNASSSASSSLSSSASSSEPSSASSSTSTESPSANLEVSFEVEGLAWDPATLANAQAENADVYAWLYVPDTNVNRPLLQSPADNEDYYLSHDINGNGSITAELYSQASYNGTDFTDPVTFFYGHTFEFGSGLEDTMFSTLHYFEDQAFFDSHPYFYIFTPDQVLKYEIVSAYEYENSHVLDSHDFSDTAALQEYYKSVLSPRYDVKNVREGAELKAGKDTIVQLATCTRPANDAYRYIVTGKLVGTMPIAS